MEDELASAHKYILEYVPNQYSITDENLRRVDAIEIKIGQSAKPGMGGHLPGNKVTPEIAAVRGREVGRDIISPAHFADIHSRDDLRRLVDSLRQRSRGPADRDQDRRRELGGRPGFCLGCRSRFHHRRRPRGRDRCRTKKRQGCHFGAHDLRDSAEPASSLTNGKRTGFRW